MNAENTFDFCPTCDNEIVENILKKNNLNCSIHEHIPEDSRNSFFKTFSSLLNLTEERILTAIRNRQREPSFVNLQIFEYGENLVPHLRGIQKISNMAWISSLAEEFNREIIVICDFYNLNFAHNSKNVLKFLPSRRVEGTDPIGCILFGLNTYHPLEFSDSLLGLRNNQNFNEFIYSSLQNITGNRAAAHNFWDEREITFVDPETRNELTTEDLGSPTETPVVSNVNIRTHPGPSVTLQDFLDEQFRDSSAQNIDIENLSSEVKLNFSRSALATEGLTYCRTHDVDGLFGVFKPAEYRQVVKCPVKFAVFPTMVDKRTSTTISQLHPPNDGIRYKSLKFGQIELPIGIIDLIIIIKSQRSINEKALTAIVESSAKKARSLPCYDDPEHNRSDDCTSQKVQNSHRENIPASIASRNRRELEKYSSQVANCYVYHFLKSLKYSLRTDTSVDFDVFFKCVGSKSFTFSENAKDCVANMKVFEEAVDFTKIDPNKIWIDYCITTSAESDTDPVSRFKFKFVY